MNKAELVERLAKENNLTKVEAQKLLNSVVKVIKKSVVKGNEVRIAGFGRWYVSKRKSRQSKNPQTGEWMTIPAARVPSFRSGRLFKDAVR